MPQGQPLPCPPVYENVPLLPVPHIMSQHLAALILPVSFMVLGARVAPGPAVVLALGFREGDLASIAVPQLDPGL